MPASPVMIGLVVEHHDDDTSTIELPTNEALTVTGDAVARGSLIRPRGRTVPVGSWAFVRDGVVETQAPDLVPRPTSVGVPVGGAIVVQQDFSLVGTLIGSTPAQAAAGFAWTRSIPGSPDFVGTGGPIGIAVDDFVSINGGAFTPVPAAASWHAEVGFRSAAPVVVNSNLNADGGVSLDFEDGSLLDIYRDNSPGGEEGLFVSYYHPTAGGVDGGFTGLGENIDVQVVLTGAQITVTVDSVLVGTIPLPEAVTLAACTGFSIQASGGDNFDSDQGNRVCFADVNVFAA
jgi:hypothetical protein